MNRRYRTEKHSKKRKNFLDRLNSRMEMTVNTINDLNDRSIKFTHCEQQREYNNKKISLTLRELWDKTKDSKFVSLESQKERRKRVFKELMAEKLLFGEK